VHGPAVKVLDESVEERINDLGEGDVVAVEKVLGRVRAIQRTARLSDDQSMSSATGSTFGPRRSNCAGTQ
jgi:hypothetical protein